MQAPPAGRRPRPAGRLPAGPPQGGSLPAGLAARAVLGGLLAVSFLGCVLASSLHHPALAGLAFCAGAALAAQFVRPSALLHVVVAVPVVFGVANLLAQLATLPGGGRSGAALPLLEGTLLTLAAVAPWLFAGTAGAFLIAMFRGLPRCVRELRTDLSGWGLAVPRREDGSSAPAGAVRRPPGGRSPR